MVRPPLKSVKRTTPTAIAMISSRLANAVGRLRASASATAPRSPPHQREPRSLAPAGHDARRARPPLGAAFLSAVADRFGLWGARGEPSVAWGDFDRFVAYTGTINPYAPDALVPVPAWTATLAEVALGVALILGSFTRTAAWLSGVLLLLFGLGMTMGTGLKSALDASVLSAAAGAFALSVLGPYPWSLDAARGRSGLDAVP